MNSLLNPTFVPETSHPVVAAPGSSADPTTVTPVVPAQAQAAPAAALDKVAGEPSVLQKALGMAQPYLAKVESVTQPYVEKVQQTTKPYTDAAINKAKELIDKVEGPGPATPGTPTSAAALGGDGATSIHSDSIHAAAAERRLSSATASTAVPSTTGTGAKTPQSLEERVDDIFVAIGRRASTVASKIDEKTATADKPGWASQLMSGVQKVTDKADAYMQSHAPTSTNQASVIGNPVATTKNTVPHPVAGSAHAPVAAGEPTVPIVGQSTTSAGAPVPIGSAAHVAPGAGTL